MKTNIRIFIKESKFEKYKQHGFIIDPEFIIPENGDIITISEQYYIWDKDYANKTLQVQYKRYNYGRDEQNEKICDIIIYVKPVKD